MTASFSRLLDPGEPVPWFRTALLGGEPVFPFDKVGGRHVLLLLFGSAGLPITAAALAEAAGAAHLFDNVRSAFFGVSIDPDDVAAGRITAERPTIHFLLDHDRAASRLFGAAETGDGLGYRPHWLLIDPAMRVLGRYRLAEGAQALGALAAALARPATDMAPVLLVPNVLDPTLCRRLVDLYEEQGGLESGVMRQVGGRTVLVTDPDHKRRRDCEIVHEDMREAVRLGLQRCLVPMIARAFQFQVTRVERYIVACYDADEDGHFNPHRDNTTLGTAHRRFAVTINLNDDYEGGDLRFPEWGARTYRAPVGGAVVFSCSMLHEATRVTRGRRYATLPFLYDEAAAKVREANLHALQPQEPPTANAG